MWLGTIVMVAAVAQEEIDAGLYGASEEALVVDGVLVEPALPLGLATMVLGAGTDLVNTASLVATVSVSTDGVPSWSTVGIESTADFNGDGKVDAADYVVWRKTDGANGDVDGRDFLIWQRGASPAVDASDYTFWRTRFGATTASVDAESWLGAKLPAVDDEVLLAPPADLELYGFEVQQDGKVRGALLWSIGDGEIVSHLWTTEAFAPLVEPGDMVSLIPVGTFESIPEFHDGFVLKLASDPIATYEQGAESAVVEALKRR